MDLTAYMAAGNCVNIRELRDRSELFNMKKLNKKFLLSGIFCNHVMDT